MQHIVAKKAIPSLQVKPMGQTFVLLTGEFNPLVSAEAARSFPIETMLVKKGTIRYSSIFIGFLMEPTSRITIASFTCPYSSIIVGKKRNNTEKGMDIFFVTCIRSIAATNSLTVVLTIRKYAIIIPGKICVKSAIIPVNRTLMILGKYGINSFGTNAENKYIPK